jgi:predicted Rossmann fold flavoprotein
MGTLSYVAVIILCANAIEAYRVAVVGGGAAGFFSAIQCADVLKQAHEVMLFETSKQPLAKVLISGGGRCNVMHDPHKSASTIAKGYPRGQRELVGPLNKLFGPWDTYDWFVQQGLELKTEDDGRVFPTTDKASSVVVALETAARRSGVKLHCSSKIISVVRPSNEKGFRVVYQVEDGAQQVLQCDRVIMATGSARYKNSLLLLRLLGPGVVCSNLVRLTLDLAMRFCTS